MFSYDILQKLLDNCVELLNATSGFESGSTTRITKKSHENILRALRKIVIANEMSEKAIICISGLQGAGKSTLMKNFYGLGDEYFNINMGRGEKIPIFICEDKACESPEMYAVCIVKQEDGKYNRERKKMKSEEFKKASSGEFSDYNTMYLELKVPFKHLNNETYAFMLLPGFEKKNDYWRNLIEFSVKCSDTSIFVFNESSFSTYENKMLLDKIHDKFGESLIYAISQSDLSEDKNVSVKQNCIEVMGISSDENDRVVCVSGHVESSLNEVWINELKKAIDKYCNAIETAKQNCKEYIYEIIEDELRPEFSTIKDALGREKGEIVQVHLENDSYLKAFDQIVKDKRTKMEKKLDSALEKSFIFSRDRLEKIFSDSSYAKQLGVKDTRPIRRTVFGENIDDIKRARERVEVALKRDNGVYDFQYAFFEAIAETSLEAVQNTRCRTIFIEDKSSELSVFDVGRDVVPTEEYIQKRQNIMHDVAALLTTTEKMNQLKHPNSAETMKIIAELGTEYFALATLNKSAELNDSLNIPELINEKLQLSYKDVASNVDKVMLGTLGITGVDILSDGVFDMVPAIASALGISVPIATAAATAIVGGILGVAVVKDLNRLKRTELNSAMNAILLMQYNIKINYLDAYDEAMLAIRARIEENLIAVSGINKQIFKRTNAIIAIDKIDDYLDIMCKEVTRKEYDIGAVFRG